MMKWPFLWVTFVIIFNLPFLWRIDCLVQVTDGLFPISLTLRECCLWAKNSSLITSYQLPLNASRPPLYWDKLLKMTDYFWKCRKLLINFIPIERNIIKIHALVMFCPENSGHLAFWIMMSLRDLKLDQSVNLWSGIRCFELNTT